MLMTDPMLAELWQKSRAALGAQFEQRAPSAVFLEGSIAEGFGNERSDVDFVAIVDNGIEPATMPYILFIDGRRVEVRLLSPARLRRELAQVREALGKGRRAVARLSWNLLERCQRFIGALPIDWVADCVAEALAKFPLVRGRTLHLTSGTPTTLREINDVCAEFPSFHVPRYVPRHVFDAAEMKPLERRYYDEVVKLYESYLTRQVRFARDATAAILPALPRATGKTLLRRIFRYGIAAGYFVPRSA